MKVLFFLRDISDCGGIQQTTVNILNYLTFADANISCETLSLYQSRSSAYFTLDEYINNYSLFTKKVNQRLDYLSIKKRLALFFSEHTFDIIIVQGALFSIYLPKNIWNTMKIVVCEHGHYYMGTRIGLHSFGVRVALKKAHSIITLTKLDAENYKKHCKRNIFINNIYNASTPLDNEIEYDVDSKTIVSCGRLDDIKRFDLAIKAAKIVFEKNPSWSWKIYGDGPNKGELKKMINVNHLQDNIFLMGYESDKRIIYSQKALYVLTSKFEGFGMVLLEAMQFGLPLVSFNVKYGPLELISNEENGYLIEDTNVCQLASRINELIENQCKREQISRNCLKMVSQFDINSIGEKWIEFLNAVYKGEL